MPQKDTAWPLEDLPQHMQDRIAWEVAQPQPPSQWREFHDDRGRTMCAVSSRGWWEWHWQRGIDPERIRKPIPQWMRARVIERDGLVCQLCGDPVEPTDVHIDHIKPVYLGGPTEIRNLQVAHSLCNIRKGAKY